MFDILWRVEIDVRLALPDDARGISEVHVQGWREAYAHLLPTESLAGLSVDKRTLRWAELIPAETPDVWVATDGDRVVGLASASSGHVDESPRDRELEGLYILADHDGSGAGQLLLEAAIGTAPAFLWVAADNPRARAFYARNGLSPDGATKVGSLAGTPVNVVRLVR